MQVRVQEATGIVLDWLVTSIECPNALGYGVQDWRDQRKHVTKNGEYLYRWSSSWAQGGPIIEREELYVQPTGFADKWKSYRWKGNYFTPEVFGNTALVAAMRCYVIKNLGHSVDVPDELF